MFFRRKGSEKDQETGQAGTLSDWTVVEDEKFVHRDYLIVPCVKQLNSGKWVVRLAFEKGPEESSQRYDFPGPMREYEDATAACKAGVQFAIRRIEAVNQIEAKPDDFE